MKSTAPSVLILGGGVAGMSAALALSGLDLAVHLVEKSKTLGGHAAQWACMATQTCENCGACLSIEMADQAKQQSNLTLHLETTVKSIAKDGPAYKVQLETDDTFSVKKIIMATGFSPFDPAQTRSLHYKESEKVITTAELNTAIKQDKLTDLLDNKKDPKIAFIQCVGSRNREQGRDYCSQVCCKISMRHANKLSFLYPDADITCFHMDLQVIGKEIRPLFDRLSQTVNLVQGVPAEILTSQETGRLSIVTEDKETQSRKAAEFDLIVLSVGMQPSQELNSTADLLNIQPNEWGFFNTDQVQMAEDIVIAGCAQGPKDIVTTRQDGRLAATKVAKEFGLLANTQNTILVWGDGPQADTVAAQAAANGFCVLLTGQGASLPDSSNVTALNENKILAVSGTIGNFSILYEKNNQNKTAECAAIIAATEPEQLMIQDGPVQKATGLDAFAQMIEQTPDQCPQSTLILLDYSSPEQKQASRLALETAVKIKELNKSVGIIMNKMLVHGAMGQRLYDAARKQGVDFFRFETPDDLKIKNQGNTFSVQVKEATLSGLNLELNCDTLVIPAAILPTPALKETAGLLKQDLDAQGFLQSANTRHRLVQSPRRGIFFAGTGHDEIDLHDFHTEIQEILSAVSAGPSVQKQDHPGIRVNSTACAHCLTCFRVCPHNALVIDDNTPKIVEDACFACHLCVSNCPAYAIESDSLANDQLAAKANKGNLALLACERSAALAAQELALPDTVDLIRIPCACRISNDVILRLLVNGASQVIVAGCHTNNCQSAKGSTFADQSVKNVMNIPGVDAESVKWEAVAANEPKKLQALF